jgi:hypothetical protein
VRLVVGFAAGGSADIIARLIGQSLSERLTQQFVIENRPGAGTNIATETVVRAVPDGYTLLLINAANAINATLYDKLNFNFVRDIAPVASITREPLFMVTNPSVPANTVLNRSRRPNGASNVNQFVALVIDTVGVRTDRPLAMIDMYGTPYSQSMHVVERYRLIDYDDVKTAMIRNIRENIKIGEMDFDRNYRGKHLQLQFTVEDQGVFTMPWSATITYARPDHEWEEHVCAENTIEFYSDGREAAVPTATKPDF